MKSILFVCLGNICRSPAAEGVLKRMLEKDELSHVHVESCGMISHHVGDLPDERMRKAAQLRGIVLESRAQQFLDTFFDRFDLILAADQQIYDGLIGRIRSDSDAQKVLMMTAFSSHYLNREVPDPYYGGQEGFNDVLDILEDSCSGLIQHLQSPSS
ncbi:MAG: protein tyrosine phosphatase [Waddliaceae bacterium]|nr:protein tyrosine phosphatase [Waddliaceae bacterium]